MWLELIPPSSWMRNLPMRPRRFRGENPHRGCSRGPSRGVGLRRFKNLMKKNAANRNSLAPMSGIVVFDRSAWVDDLGTARHQPRISSRTGLNRASSAVLAELWRSATKPAELKFVGALEKNHRILTPTDANWLESGKLLSRLRLDTGFTAEKLRSLHFDVLIALTARSHGVRLITTNPADFELIYRYRKFNLEVR